MDYKDDIKYRIRLTLYKNEKSFGIGIAELLRLVDEKGNLTSAYEEMKLSSSKGWKIVNNAENDLGIKLLETKIGGSDGGGSKLTPEARDLLERYQGFLKELEEASEELFKKYFG